MIVSRFSNVCEVGLRRTVAQKLCPILFRIPSSACPTKCGLEARRKVAPRFSLVHTLVTTLQMRAFGDVPGLGPGERNCVFEQLLHEEAVLPTVPVSNTDHVCVGKAVFRALEKWFCGDILQFIHKLEHVGLLLFVGTADRAS